MCNLYSVTKGQAAIIALTRAMRDTTGNLPPMPGVFSMRPPRSRKGLLKLRVKSTEKE